MKQRLEQILQKSKRILGDMIASSKNALIREYSMQNLRRLPHVFKGYWQQMLNRDSDRDALKGGDANAHLHLRKSWNVNALLGITRQWSIVWCKWILALLLLLVAAVTFQSLINPYAQHLRDKLGLRPTQLAQLEQLVLLSKSSGPSGRGSSVSVLNGSAAISLLDETELQKIQLAFTSRGIKLGVLRLIAENPPNIELQANEVMFSVLLDALEELRVNWHLYPTQMNVLAGSGTGLVSVSGTLKQYSTQLGVTP